MRRHRLSRRVFNRSGNASPRVYEVDDIALVNFDEARLDRAGPATEHRGGLAGYDAVLRLPSLWAGTEHCVRLAASRWVICDHQSGCVFRGSNEAVEGSVRGSGLSLNFTRPP